MRALAASLALFATPAMAHHEVVVVTSMVPVIAGVSVISAAAAVAFWKRWRKR